MYVLFVSVGFVGFFLDSKGGREERRFANNDIIIYRLSIPIFWSVLFIWGNLELGPSKNGMMAA